VTVQVAWSPDAGPALLSEAATRAAVEAALAHGGRAGLEISVAFVDDAGIAELHGRWLGDPTPTDVLSFDLGADQPGPAGEVIVSAERAAEVAGERGLDPVRELALYVVHGTLHLCGFDDRAPAERARMRAAESEVLAALGYAAAPGADETE
jgi:probable rRNA maturation factor